MSCQRAQGYLESVGGTVTALQDAKKTRIGAADVLALVHTVDKVVAAKGKKIVTFDLKGDRPDDETLLAHLLGPTGNLRAPAAIVGRTLVVGFNEDVYRHLL